MTNVNHHTGGLEIFSVFETLPKVVNHHTGGLEIKLIKQIMEEQVNHHTGGLEMLARPPKNEK